jgi:thioredoxin 1
MRTANEGYSVEFINIDKDGDQATQYNVRSVPTVVIIENGVEVDRFIGALPKRKVLQKLNG